VNVRAVIVTPAPRGSRSGNRTTALRWAGLLRQLGVHVRVVDNWQGEACDVLIAVHAVKTAASVLAATTAHPGLRVVVLLAGTDVYPRFEPSATTSAALARANALIALQPHTIPVLPAELRPRARTIVQSATTVPVARAATFRACVLAHLRPVKDPLLPFRALSHVDPGIAIEVVLAGRAMTPDLESEVRAACAREPRLRWVGDLRRRAAKELLASSHVCIVPSSAEGGANVVSEAIAASTPVLATSIPGNLGLLGADWPALFPVGDEVALGRLLAKTATDRTFWHRLVERTRALLPMVAPAQERAAWRQLLADLRLD
jgi:putative glycosyltransferase (TIGR04348 family)